MNKKGLPTIMERREQGLRPVVHATNGDELLVDPEDLFVVARFRWQPHGIKADSTVYYATPLGSGVVYLGHLVLPRPEWARDMVQIHVNGDPRDGRKTNLAWVTQSVVRHRSDRPKRTDKSSQFRGVRVEPRTGNFVASICVDGKKHYLGSHHSEIEAARAYNRGAIEHFGLYARLNEIPDEPPNSPRTRGMVPKARKR